LKESKKRKIAQVLVALAVMVSGFYFPLYIT